MKPEIVGYTGTQSIHHNDTCDRCGQIELLHAVKVRGDFGLLNLGTGCAAVVIYGRQAPKLAARIERQAREAQEIKDKRNAHLTERADYFAGLADAAERDGRESKAWEAMCAGFRASQGKWAVDYIREHGGILSATRDWAAEFRAKIEA